MTILPVDEINAFEDRLKVHFTDEGNGKFTRQEGSCIMQVIIKNDKVSAIEYYPAK